MRAVATAMAVALTLPPLPAFADAPIATVRDAETEALITDYLRPIVKVAGQQMPTIVLVNSQTFNAFVTTGHRLFINIGTIIRSDTPGALMGVLAHETGHIAHNDVARLKEAVASTSAAMLLATLAGVGIGVAAGGSARGAGPGLISGGATIAERSLLTYKREIEAAADRASVDYLNKIHESGAGMLAVLQKLANDSLLDARNANPYLQTHPLPRERITTLEHLVKASPYYGQKDSPALQERHDLVRAKLIGFTWSPVQVMRHYPLSDNSLPARYARAIAVYRNGRAADALKQVEDLTRAKPDDPYFWELYGQILLETGKPKEALAPLHKAVALAPHENLIKVLLGQALVAVGSPADASEAVRLLSAAVINYPDLPGAYRALARAYAMQGNIPMAQLATAQGLVIEGNLEDARIQAAKAQEKLKRGSPAWLRADDIVSYKGAK
jgi:predicted Zn-dependent protease